LEELFRKHKVKIAYIFGSQKEKGLAFLKGETVDVEKHSDLDIGVVFDRLPQKKFEIYGDLYVDLSLLFKPFNIDIVFLQETDALFQYEAIKGALIYCEDEFFLDDYEELVTKRAADLSYKKIEFEKDFLEAVKDGYFEIANR
jgi:predicted nucleotidyltransferase